MKNEKITIADIAGALGISTVSISRALTGQPGVSEELKRKIIAKAKEMGYAKAKKNGQFRILVLYQQLYNHPADSSNLGHKLQGIERALQNAHVHYNLEFVAAAAHDSGAIPYNLAQGFLFDGVILIGRFSRQYARLIRQKIDHLLFFTGYSPAYEFDCVWYNFNNAGYKIAEYLIQKNHRQIAFVGDTKLFRNTERLFGISAALAEYELALRQEFLVDTGADYLQRVRELLGGKTPPTALICDYDFTAFELLKLLHEENIRVPQDVSIIGSGNTEMAALSIPALTTLDLNIEYSCAVAVATLLKRIAHPELPYENISILSKLIERDSVRAL